MINDITCLRNTKREKYLKWIDKNLLELYSINDVFRLQKCVQSSNFSKCIRLLKIIGRGGTGKIILGKYSKSTRCSYCFSVSPRFAVKLCDGLILDNLSCRDLIQEIIIMLEYSKLFAKGICNNFLYCIGYGINCCLLVSKQEIDKLNENKIKYSDLKNYSILQELNYDIPEYIEEIQDSGCDLYEKNKWIRFVIKN